MSFNCGIAWFYNHFHNYKGQITKEILMDAKKEYDIFCKQKNNITIISNINKIKFKQDKHIILEKNNAKIRNQRW